MSATDTWTSSGAASAAHQISLDGAHAQTFDSSAGSGADTATFTGVSAGRHTVQFSSESQAITLPLTVCPATVSISQPRTITATDGAVISAVLTDITNHAPLPASRVTLYYRTSNRVPFRPYGSDFTDLRGHVSIGVSPMIDTEYAWVFAGNQTGAPALSRPTLIVVRQRITVRFAPGTSNTRVGFWGTVQPALAGGQVYVQRFYAGAWHTITGAPLLRRRLPDGTTQVGYLVYAPQAAGTWRIYRPANPHNAPGASPNMTVIRR